MEDGEIQEGAHDLAPQGGELSRAQRYRRQLTATVTLPSGNEFVVKRGSLQDFFQSGTIPAPVVDTFFRTRRPQEIESPTPEQIRKQVDSMNYVVAQFVVDPEIVLAVRNDQTGEMVYPPLADNQLGVWQMIDADKMALFEIAQEDAGVGVVGAARMEKFRLERSRSDGAAHDGGNVRATAVRPDRSVGRDISQRG